MKEHAGGDNLAVRWQLPQGTIEEPIPASRLLPYGIAFSQPVIAQHPADTVAVEGGSATFTFEFGNTTPVEYQWQRNQVDFEGATGPTYVHQPAQMADHRALPGPGQQQPRLGLERRGDAVRDADVDSARVLVGLEPGTGSGGGYLFGAGRIVERHEPGPL
jgi:hypothetical protein